MKVNGELQYLWRAVDHEGEVFEFFVNKGRDKAGALIFLKKAIKRYGRPEIIAIGGLRSSGAATAFFRLFGRPPDRMQSLHRLQPTV